jgi:hypothetical protein
VSDYLDCGRDNIKLFTNVFTDPAKLCATLADLFGFFYIVDDIHSGKIRGQRFSSWLLASMLGDAQRFFFCLLKDLLSFIKQMELLAAFVFVRTAFFTFRSKNHLFQNTKTLLQILYLCLSKIIDGKEMEYVQVK